MRFDSLPVLIWNGTPQVEFEEQFIQQVYWQIGG